VVTTKKLVLVENNVSHLYSNVQIYQSVLKIFELKLTQNLYLFGDFQFETYSLLLGLQFFDSNLKICLLPGIEAKKVEKYWVQSYKTFRRLFRRLTLSNQQS